MRAFKVLEPERFRELARLLDTRRMGREDYINRAIAELTPKLAEAGLEADLQGRPKHIYSIDKKMQRKSAEFAEIGEKTGTTADGARMRFQRALPKLAQKIKQLQRGEFDEIALKRE